MSDIRSLSLLDEYATEKYLAKETVKSYQAIIRVFIRDTNIYTLNIELKNILNWRKNVLERSKIVTWNTYLRHMRALSAFATTKKYIDKNIFKAVSMLSTPKAVIKVISDNDLNSIYKLLENKIIENSWFWKAIIDILYYTGMRRRQLLGLTWKDINIIDGTITLSAPLSKTKTEVIIPINNKLLHSIKRVESKLIRKNIAIQPNDQFLNITLFSKKKQKYNQTSINHLNAFYAKISKEIGINVSSHKFRHTMATKIANNTNNIKTLSQILGHADVATTMMYVHPNLENMRTSIDIL